jgi:hypothetical protein
VNDQTLDQRIAECGRQMAMAALPAYTTNGNIHPPTLVAACARMAGTYLFRSFQLHIEGLAPGDVVLSPQASEQTPLLLRTCAAVLSNLGIAIPSSPQEPMIDGATKSREELPETNRRLDPIFEPLKGKYSLDDLQMARAAAVAAAVATYTVRQHLEPTRGFGVAAYSFMEGSRTVPAAKGSAGNTA